MTTIFSTQFAKAAGERAIRAGAAATLSAWVVGDGILNALSVDWPDAGGIFLGGAVVSVLMSLAGNAATGDGPAFTDAEKVTRTTR